MLLAPQSSSAAATGRAGTHERSSSVERARGRVAAWHGAELIGLYLLAGGLEGKRARQRSAAELMNSTARQHGRFGNVPSCLRVGPPTVPRSSWAHGSVSVSARDCVPTAGGPRARQLLPSSVFFAFLLLRSSASLSVCLGRGAEIARLRLKEPRRW